MKREVYHIEGLTDKHAQYAHAVRAAKAGDQVVFHVHEEGQPCDWSERGCLRVEPDEEV